MKFVTQPERPGPLEEGYRRPEPWTLEPKRNHEDDGSGWYDTSGVRVWVQETDVTGDFKLLSNKDILELAAHQIHGGSAHLSDSLEFLGTELITQNNHAKKFDQTEELVRTMVFHGVTLEEVGGIVAQMVGESTAIQDQASPQFGQDTLMFHR